MGKGVSEKDVIQMQSLGCGFQFFGSSRSNPGVWHYSGCTDKLARK